MKISVIIIAGNEEKKIEDCLKTIEWADEIVFVDSESSDNTVNIAKRFTNKIYVKKWKGFAAQKRFALEQTTNDWVLSLDADERVSELLKLKLLNIKVNDFSAFKIKRDNYLLGKKIKTCGWDKDYQLRFFNKSKTQMNNRLVHEGFETEGSVAIIEEPIIHYTYSSITEALEKINRYSTLQAKEYLGKKKSNAFMLLLHSFSAFFRFFISLKGYRDGYRGMLVSFFNSITTFLTYVKIKELENN